MIRQHALHRSFTSGLISKLLRCRTDLKQFRQGCFTLKNMIGHVQGPVSTRPGFEFVYDLSNLAGVPRDGTFPTFSDGSPAVRLVPFIYSEEQSYLMIFMEMYSGSYRVYYATQGGLVSSGGSPVYTSVTSPFDLQNFDYAQYNDVLFMAQGGKPPTRIVRESESTWSFSEISFTSVPTEWNETDGYPERVSVYEQRVVYASTTVRPTTLWFTKSGYPYDFSTSSPQVVSDAVTYTIGAGKKDAIQWLISQQKLLIGTLAAEHAISGSGDSALSFESVSATRHTSIGSRSIKPIEVTDEAYFIGKSGEKAYRYAYSYEADGFRATDMTALYPEAFTDAACKSWGYQADPNSTIWACDTDGNLLSLTTYYEHSIASWQRHDTSGSDLGVDKVIDVEAVPGDVGDTELYIVAEREATYDGYSQNTYLYLEKLRPLERGNDAKLYYLQDSLKGEVNESGVASLDLTHLSGRTVDVLVEGNLYTDVEVPSNDPVLYFTDATWTHLLDGRTPTSVSAGVPYSTEVAATPSELDNIAGGVTGLDVRLVEVVLHLYRTADGVKVSILGDDGEVIQDDVRMRSLDDIDTSAPNLITESIRVPVPSKIVNEVTFSVKQEHARPLTLLGITDVLDVKK